MSAPSSDAKGRCAADRDLFEIAEFVASHRVEREDAYEQARSCLVDALASGLSALRWPEVAMQIGGPQPRNAPSTGGARVPGTSHLLDPAKAAFDLGLTMRWPEFDETWLGEERGRPSDHLAAILATADFVSRRQCAGKRRRLWMRDVLAAMIKAHQIQRALVESGYDRTAIDPLALTKVASTAVAAHLLGATAEQIVHALAHAWADGHGPRAHRHGRDAAEQTSQASGDVASRAVRFALMALQGETVPAGLRSEPRWGLHDVLCQSGAFKLHRLEGAYAIEDVVLRLDVPAECHALTAVECALRLHPQVTGRVGEIRRIALMSHEPAIRLVCKEGPLRGAAERRHSLQYSVAVCLLRGQLSAHSYDDASASDSHLDALRAAMRVVEDPRFTGEYFDPDKRAIGNAMQVLFADGSATQPISIDYPIGHRHRREEGAPLLEKRLSGALAQCLPRSQAEAIGARCAGQRELEETPVDEFMDLLAS